MSPSAVSPHSAIAARMSAHCAPAASSLPLRSSPSSSASGTISASFPASPSPGSSRKSASRSASSSPLSAISGGGGAPLFRRRTAMQRLGGLLLPLIGSGGAAGPAVARSKVSEAEEVLRKAEWPQQFPFSAEDFKRYDETPDTVFYSMPRFVTHIDDAAIRALTQFYKDNLPPPNTPGVSVLDMCSSWISHYPKGYKQERVVGMGLNEDELARNDVLTEYLVQDLNANTKLPFPDNTFDAITNAVSVDYLSRPLEVFQEMHRVLKPGGLAVMSFSNRCFWTKAIQIWTSTGDIDHILIVGSYFHYAGGYEPPQARDISPNPGRTDPMYVVFSRKLEA
ncbi:hypothetical protein CLOM_g17267 [Closterium sp. NIES-68]|nr:hypothetical protein CLOM_g17267 [Closterium sp. NIES-68]GJP72677.1 hypothetical protein CLOP_g3443 [Closterium sp. NIES-67]